MSWLWFICLALLFLLPPVSFAKAHLWKYRPFRANDTDHSGGDHICDLRRDSSADGKPDRLGDYVTVSGSVIVEPSTFETGGWLFWMRERGCGILVYGEQEALRLGDSVTVRGWVRISNGGYFFPETGLATLGDVSLENGGVILHNSGGNHDALSVSPEEYAACPEDWAGNLITLSQPMGVSEIRRAGGDTFAWAHCGRDSTVLYLDGDTSCEILAGACYMVTGVVTRMLMPSGSPVSPAWCLAPRYQSDIAGTDCLTRYSALCWGRLKAEYDGE
jgi:hypothetical protein